MKRLSFLISLTTFLLVFGCTCNSSSTVEEEQDYNEQNDDYSNAEDGEKDLEDAMEDVKEAMENINTQNGTQKAVNHKALKKILPPKIRGYSTENIESQSAGYAGMKVVTATGEYKDGKKNISINLADTGGIPMAMAAMAAWKNLEMEKEGSYGFERTTTYKGNPMMEKENRNNNTAEIALILEDRFVLQLEGDNVTVKDLRKVLDKMDVKDLKKMAN